MNKTVNQVTAADAVRVQSSLLAPLERVCLNWLARQMPRWVTPDFLTALGFFAMIGAGASYASARWWPAGLLLANFWLALNWFGDSLDGTLARFRNKLRPRYGYYVDHIVDTIGALVMLSGLALSGYMTPLVALCLLIGFYLLSIDLYLATYTRRIFKLSFLKFSPTEMRILIAIGNLFALDHKFVRFLGERYLFFDVAGVIATVAMLLVFLASAAINTVALYRAERV